MKIDERLVHDALNDMGRDYRRDRRMAYANLVLVAANAACLAWNVYAGNSACAAFNGLAAGMCLSSWLNWRGAR